MVIFLCYNGYEIYLGWNCIRHKPFMLTYKKCLFYKDLLLLPVVVDRCQLYSSWNDYSIGRDQNIYLFPTPSFPFLFCRKYSADHYLGNNIKIFNATSWWKRIVTILPRSEPAFHSHVTVPISEFDLGKHSLSLFKLGMLDNPSRVHENGPEKASRPNRWHFITEAKQNRGEHSSQKKNWESTYQTARRAPAASLVGHHRRITQSYAIARPT